jgi:hypothetical protein
VPGIRDCLYCGKPLPADGQERLRFCRGSRCRSNWHADRRRQLLAEAIRELEAAIQSLARRDRAGPLLVHLDAVRLRLAQLQGGGNGTP